MGGAVGQQRIPKDFIDNSIIYIPEKPIQQSITRKLDLLSTKSKKLEYIYQQKLASLDELKRSLLQNAFSGKL